MSVQSQPGADNVASLLQGIELVQRLDDSVFRGSPDGLRIGGVGAQLRHCIDFYLCFGWGIDSGEIDYSRRTRDPEVETDRVRAIATIEQIVRRLEGLGSDDPAREIRVRADGAPPDAGDEAWSRSTVGRELQFLLSHTIHHYALIVTLLKLQGVDLSTDFAQFGVAPSTLRYWKESGSLTG